MISRTFYLRSKTNQLSKDNIGAWNDNAIGIKVPKDLTVNTEYNIIIQKDEFVTEPTDNSIIMVTA